MKENTPQSGNSTGLVMGGINLATYPKLDFGNSEDMRIVEGKNMFQIAIENKEVVEIIVDTMKQCKGEIKEQRRRFSVDASAVAELGKAVSELGKAYAMLMVVSPDD